MQPLEKPFRKKLEDTVKDARDTAEAAARAILEQLGVGEAAPYNHLTDAERELRRKLRAHARQLGDVRNARTEIQEIGRLIEEVAYEHWHRMLFARFLAENNLLMYPDPDDQVAVSLEECEDLAADEGAKNGWELASRFAARMLPQIFRPDSPVFQLDLPPEHQQKLERLVAKLPPEVFTASDSLGWVYQFWQAKKKDEVNASEVKIGARELPAVTQLFTEPYMVAFLLDNSLGAWWASRRLTEADFRNAESEDELRHKAALPGLPLKYLRFVKVTRPSRSGPHLDERTLSISEGENLPHWTCDRAVYHVSFRLADSVPQSKRDEWLRERDSIIENAASLRRDLTAEEEKKIRFLYSERIEKYLDAGHGDCVLARSEIAELVANALKHFDGERYLLHAWCVMPNHVHVIVEPLTGWELSKIIHSWKSFTAHEANKRLNRSGDFWQRDAYNHIIRSEKEYCLQVQYTWENPDKAGLRDWVWRWKIPDRDGLATTWIPAAGSFQGWPKHLSEFKILDPCCGSGHFLVAAFLMLVAMRIEMEGLSAHEAAGRVLAENIFGLEIDQRCVELAAFALALAAWRLTGYRPLPTLQLACTGLAVGGTREQWMDILAGQAVVTNLRFFFGQLYDLFSKAPTLGSLINPHRFLGSGLLDDKGMANLHRALASAMALESKSVTERSEMGVTAQGVAKAAELLAGRYTLVATNVPYLGRGKQDEVLKEHLETHYPLGKADLATAFVLRCLEFCAKGCSTALVTPQNWLFLTTYTKLRRMLLENRSWNAVARLGPGAFETISGHVVNVALPMLSATKPADDHTMAGIDVSAAKEPEEKAAMLRGEEPAELLLVKQAEQLKNPDARIVFELDANLTRLEALTISRLGLGTGDSPHYLRKFWEMAQIGGYWQKYQTAPDNKGHIGGHESVIAWDGQKQKVYGMSDAEREQAHNQDYRGREVWGRSGVAVSIVGNLKSNPYYGNLFDKGVAVIAPKNSDDLSAVRAYVEADDFVSEIRKIDQKVMVTNATLIKVPFDLAHWQKIAAEKYPHGLPEPESDDPTQWLFHGRPEHSTAPLGVVVGRLLGYRWPAEMDEKMRLSPRARELVKRCDEMLPFADKDGIVCVPPVRGEASAADRLLNLLASAYGNGWSTDILSALLKGVGFADKSLETWLRDGFFAQHCELFHQRPFIWQIWDGLRDGFSALVNYHKLDRKNLETLIFTYLGDWIKRQKDDIASRVDGAQERLAAAETLKKRLELILEGEPPYDIFVRWKPIEKQPIGWDPDLNDGVRLNIRPFLNVPDVKTKGAGVLRVKPKIKWDKDRGKEPKRPFSEYPWFWGWDGSVDYAGGLAFTGDRFNDCHYTISFKRQARRQLGNA